MTFRSSRLAQYLYSVLVGAVFDCIDKDGNTPLHIAARYGHELLINTLLENGADPSRFVVLRFTS